MHHRTGLKNMIVNRGETNIEKDIEGEKKPCKNCGAIVFVMDEFHGETICSGCGRVIKSRVVDPGRKAAWYSCFQGVCRMAS